MAVRGLYGRSRRVYGRCWYALGVPAVSMSMGVLGPFWTRSRRGYTSIYIAAVRAVNGRFAGLLYVCIGSARWCCIWSI